ncbi:helix-turn-helix transcriptional regulator [Pseudooceanicola sp. HF7]|uniref:ArsR/SmtB family transcription factor n=1 Tax=Pseudooceanicola sp. HF7 TaxID=2721560 RepID=UPI001430FBAA|nr:helix-turn-helix transcriptional regulator [Pseudooceanicola sp. HF7]NIZ10650.1 helix-turn-helix transcriptional regulator [Pseudooceanicola sp. HF7]
MQRQEALDCLAALSNETRLDIVHFLVRHGPEGASAGHIAQTVSVSASRLSFHLNVLEQAGIVAPERRGRMVFYRALRDRIGGTIGYLLSDCCAGDTNVRSCCLNEMAQQAVTPERKGFNLPQE